MAPQRRPIPDRIKEQINIDSRGCWIWQGCFTKDGYGVFNIGRKQVRVHRASYECFVGPITNGMHVCHKCDVIKCVNPDHLFIGTPKDNTQDCVKKGRRAKIQPNHRKVSEEGRQNIKLLRKSGKKLTEIAQIYGITFQTVSAICLGKL